MERNSEFEPNWASAPGETILDILSERSLSLHEFADQLGQPRDAVEDLIGGRARITIALARDLERVLGSSVEFWMVRDYHYHQSLSRLDSADPGTQQQWLRELPVEDMIDLGWIPSAKGLSERMAACLSFFGVLTVASWRLRYATVESAIAFRTSPTFRSEPAAVAAWLRRGEIEAESIDCERWDPSAFVDSLRDIRALTRQKSPESFIPRLAQRCAQSGVAVVVVRAPKGCRASGAAKFLSKSKALLLLSMRHLTDDHFWFTFFHEAGHLLLHNQDDLFVDGDEQIMAPEEKEANEFAERILVPKMYQERLLSLSTDPRAVMRFAREVGVSRGIVVGQMQHHRVIGFDKLNYLKQRYEWSDQP